MSFTPQEMLQKYLDAEARILKGQRVRWGDRDLTMADLSEIRAGRKEWEQKAANTPVDVVTGAPRCRTGVKVAAFS